MGILSSPIRLLKTLGSWKSRAKARDAGDCGAETDEKQTSEEASTGGGDRRDDSHIGQNQKQLMIVVANLYQKYIKRVVDMRYLQKLCSPLMFL